MKLLILSFIFLLLFSEITKSQELKTFLNDSATTYKSLNEFRKNTALLLSDTSFKIKSYVVYFGCDYNFHKVSEEICNVSVSTIFGNSLQDSSFIELLNKYNQHFYIVFDNIMCVDKNGLTKVALSPGRINIL
jgi:hypothetical protein